MGSPAYQRKRFTGSEHNVPAEELLVLGHLHIGKKHILKLNVHSGDRPTDGDQKHDVIDVLLMPEVCLQGQRQRLSVNRSTLLV